jgi:hypothetical protein
MDCILWLGELKSLPMIDTSLIKCTQTGDTFLTVMKNTALCHLCGNSFPVRWYTTSLLPSCSYPSRKWVSWLWVRKRGTHSLEPSFFRFDTSEFLLLGVCKGQCLSWKSAKCEWVVWQNYQSCRVHSLPLKFLTEPGRKLNIILMCIMPLIVSTLRSAEYLRNFVMSSVCKCINFSSILYGWIYHVLFYCHLSPDTLYFHHNESGSQDSSVV